MQLDVVVTHTPSLWLRVANWLGADIKWTHAFLRYRVGRALPRIIEAGAEGVSDDRWRPDKYHEYEVHSLQNWCFDEEAERQRAYDRMYSFAAGEVGKRYRFGALPLILWRMIRKLTKLTAAQSYRTFIGTGEVCTSLVDRTFLWGGFDLVPGETSPFLLPDEIACSPLLEMIEQGDRQS